MKLYEMIGIRQSIRDFQMKELAEPEMNAIYKYMKEILPLYPDIPYQIVIHNAMEEAFQKGTALFSVKAPYYISFMSKRAPGYLENAGYILEELSLFLNTKGIGSCYQGALKVEKDTREMTEVLVMAAGYPKPYIYREEGSAKRLPLNKLCVFKEEPDKEVVTILKAAALAPSSLNGQPWRFVVYKNRIHVFVQKNTLKTALFSKMRMIDIGIALNHMMVAAEELWVEAELKALDNISNQSFKRNEYVISLILKQT